ncbi:MAG: kinase [Lachnospiraceae bacterium]|nr:kinase [Lachnospiraceae bacterium]
MALFKKKEKVRENRGIFNNAVDYSVYHMSFSEKLIGGFVGYGLGFIALYVFFQFLPLSIIAPIFLIPVGINVFNKILRERRDNMLVMQFRDMLESLTTSYDSGNNTNEAFADAYKDMVTQFGDKAYISKEMKIINQGIQNNLTIEQMLNDFGARSHNEDIQSFADVFVAANRAGGNINSIIRNTKTVISDKINIELELETLISGKKNELNIMIVLPFIIVTQVQGFNSGATDAKAVIIGVVSRIVALIMFVVAYIIGQKMIKIKL